MDAATVAISVAILGTVPGVLAYHASTAANRRTEESARRADELAVLQVDVGAFDRAKGIYEAALHTVQEQLTQAKQQCDWLSQQLAREHAITTELRKRIDRLTTQLADTEQIIADLRKQLPPPTIGGS